jgi:hypothetical protein
MVKATGAAPASGKRSAECAAMPSTSTPGTNSTARQKPRLGDSHEELRTQGVGQPESSGSTTVRGSTEDVVFQLDYPRVRDDEATLACTAETSSSEYVVTSSSMSAQPQPEVAAAAAVLVPTEASLLRRAETMFLGGPGGPHASGSDEAPVLVTNGLVLNASDAITTLFKSHRTAIQAACGVLDEREALARLIGEAAGLGRIPAEAARKAGDKAGKLVWVKKGTPPIKADLADARRAVQRRASKLPEGASLEEALEDARMAVLRTAVTLHALPSREECEAAERARVRAVAREEAAAARPPPPPPPPPPERDPRLVAWCSRHRCEPANLMRYMGERAGERRKRERAWHSTRWREVNEKAQWLRLRNEDDCGWCTCAEGAHDQGTPSWLCRVNLCYATAAGATCDERVLPCRSCDCMGWNEEEHGQPSRSRELACHRPRDNDWEQTLVRWHPPTPVGGWPVLEPPAEPPRDIERLRQHLADEREDAAIGRRRAVGVAAPPAPASVSMAELLRLVRERPEAVTEIRATIARQDLTEAQKWAEMHRIMREQ